MRVRWRTAEEDKRRQGQRDQIRDVNSYRLKEAEDGYEI